MFKYLTLMYVSCEMLVSCQIKKMHTETEQELHRGYSDHVNTSAFIRLYNRFCSRRSTRRLSTLTCGVFTPFKKFRMSLIVKACILSHLLLFP